MLVPERCLAPVERWVLGRSTAGLGRAGLLLRHISTQQRLLCQTPKLEMFNG